jgi:uncharacterized protein (TIGR02145 family)
MAGPETTVSVSDSSGNLLFYSEGEAVFNRLHLLMPNGNMTLNGGGEQSVLAIKKPNTDSLYYLFTINGNPTELRYSVIDMRLDAGRGDIISGMKNILMPDGADAFDGIHTTRHQNNKDTWVVVRKSGKYGSYLVDTSGIHNPVISNSILVPPVGQPEGAYIKVSRDGTKLLANVWATALYEYCNFNKSTGVITPLFTFIPNTGIDNQYESASFDFSRSTKYVYVGAYNMIPPFTNNSWALFQYDATKTDSAEFMQSQVLIDTLGPHYMVFGLQLAPDEKIYGAVTQSNYLCVIDNPEAQGLACNFQPYSVFFNPDEVFGYPPQVVQKYFVYIRHTGSCIQDLFQFNTTVWPPADSVHWDFGDPGSGPNNFSNLSSPTHTFSAPGNYLVLAIVRHNDNRMDTGRLNITVGGYLPSLGPDQSICLGDSVTFDAGACAGCTYVWKDIGSGLTVGTSQTFKTGLAGSYSVTVTSSDGCIESDTVQLLTTPVPSVTNNPLSKTICSGGSTNIALTSSVSGTNFHWTASLTLGNITGFSADSGLVINQILTNSLATPGIVTYHITPKNGNCSGTTVDFQVTINPGDSVKVNISTSANNICSGTSVTFTANPTNPGATPVYQWKVNGINSGTNSPSFNYTPLNGDIVTCMLTSSIIVCISNNPATSIGITMVVNPNLPVSITISPDANPVCPGTCLGLDAIVVNGGTSPFYQWFVNGNNVFLSNSNLTNGLVAYYPFNGNANDASGNGNNGTVNGAILSSDRFGNLNSAYSFNGTTNLINCGHSNSLQLTNALTISMWFKSTDINIYGEYLLSKSLIPNNYEYCIPVEFIQGVSQLLAAVGGVNFVEAGIGSEPTINVWHIVSATFNYPGYLKIYYDGTLIDSTITTGAITPTSQDLVIGCIRPTGEPTIRYFTGEIDDIRIYNRALSNCEISQLFSEGTSSFSINPNNGDVITCTVNSSATCAINNPSTSAPVTITVNPILPVSVSITALTNPFCPGSPVTFTATPVNGGITPSYQWKVNGINAGTNNPNFTYNPVNGDQVICILTSSELCTSGNPASSITITMIENNSLPAGVSIAPSGNPFCPGSSVTFTATPVNGGAGPAYQWKVNGINVGINSSTYTYNPANNDSVRCIMTSNLGCVTGNPASSGKIIMSGTLLPIVTFTSCFDTITTINAKPIKLKGGIPLGGTYSGPGVNSLTGIYTPALAGVGTHTITYTYTNAALCTATKSTSILNLPSSILICGNPLTDVRDNKVYQTVQLGVQCWLATNLNYGTILASSQDQRDNCIVEKYCYNDNPVNCTNYGGLYQWDKLMLFDETPADQGFCPPAWHIPTENEWNTLFATYINSGFAGSPLKYSGFSGFNALLSGARLINKGWDLQGFATLFWSSTPRGTAKAWAQGMNEDDPSVSLYPSSRVNALSVRCLKD